MKVLNSDTVDGIHFLFLIKENVFESKCNIDMKLLLSQFQEFTKILVEPNLNHDLKASKN